MAAHHVVVTPNKDCLACMEPVELSNLCDYKTSGGGDWHNGGYCCDCTQMLLDTQYAKFMEQIELAAAGSKDACKKAIRTMITKGSPVFLSDSHAYPCGEGEHVAALWFGSDSSEHSSRLKGSLDPDEHKKQWDFYKEFLPGLSQETNDD